MRHTDPNEHKLCRVCGTAFYYRDHMQSYQKRKYCSMACYRAWLKHTPERTRDVFWAKVDKDGAGGCWIWMGCRNQWNYGLGKISTKSFQAHRQSYEWAHGPIPDGMLVLHRCDNPPCCNPAHLWLGTNADNKADCVAKGRQSRGERTGQNLLTAAQVIEIRSRYRRTMIGKRTTESNGKELAAEYGVSAACISHAALRQTWKHLP